MTQWQKIQCQKLNIPVIDPVEDTRMFTYNYNQYRTNSVATTEYIPDSELNWYDRTKRDMGTDFSWYKTTIGRWVFQTPYMRD